MRSGELAPTDDSPDTELMRTFLVVAALRAGQVLAAERVAQFSFKLFDGDREVSSGRIATRVDDREHALIRVTDRRGAEHTARFLTLSAGKALAVPVTFDGETHSGQLEAGGSLTVRSRTTRLVLTLDEVTSGR